MVEVELKTWGNSIGLILPADLLRDLELQAGDCVDVEIISKNKIDGFGICKDAKPFQEDRESHKKFW